MDFNSHLGLESVAGSTEVALETRDEHQVAPGIIHFAVLATLAEVAAARAVGVPVVPAGIQIQLLKRASPGRLIGRGQLLRKGRRIAVAEGEVLQEGHIVAKASVTFAVL